MEKCLVCHKELDKEEKEFCETCKTFLEWKHRRERNPLSRIRMYFANRIKLGRLK